MWRFLCLLFCLAVVSGLAGCFGGKAYIREMSSDVRPLDTPLKITQRTTLGAELIEINQTTGIVVALDVSFQCLLDEPLGPFAEPITLSEMLCTFFNQYRVSAMRFYLKQTLDTVYVEMDRSYRPYGRCR